MKDCSKTGLSENKAHKSKKQLTHFQVLQYIHTVMSTKLTFYELGSNALIWPIQSTKPTNTVPQRHLRTKLPTAEWTLPPRTSSPANIDKDLSCEKQWNKNEVHIKHAPVGLVWMTQKRTRSRWWRRKTQTETTTNEVSHQTLHLKNFKKLLTSNDLSCFMAQTATTSAKMDNPNKGMKTKVHWIWVSGVEYSSWKQYEKV